MGKQMKRKLIQVTLCVFFISVCVSCSTTQKINFPQINEYLVQNDFESAQAWIENAKKEDKHSVYNARNDIGYMLDKGLLAHYIGNYKESAALLIEAERLIEEAFTKSIRADLKAFAMVNPYKQEYPGEDFENIYVNVFTALNFYQLGDIEKAMVEVRRVNEKLRWINDSYAAHYERTSTQFKEEMFGKVSYYDKSALANYLAALMWRGQGRMDDARIDFQGVSEAFAAAPRLYSHPLPPELIMRGNVCDELVVPSGMARLNFLSFTGLSPYKIALSTGGVMVTNIKGLSYRRSSADRIEVVFDDGRRVNLSLLEPLDKIAQDIFETRENYRRAIWTAHSLGSSLGSALLTVATLGVYEGPSDEKKNTALDLRMSQTLPARAYVGGINLAPGNYSFTINYYNGRDLIDSRRIVNRRISAGTLNLVQDFCLKFNETPTPQMLNEKTIAALPSFPGRPAAPTGLTATYVPPPPDITYEYEHHKLSWNPVPGAVAYYVYSKMYTVYNPNTDKIEYRYDKEDYYLIDATTETEVFDRLLQGGRRPHVKIIAVGEGGVGIPSQTF